ncbi:MAG: phycobilisome linker polypeptide [Synechococcus sp.]
MGITLTAEDTQFDVELLGDVLPGSSDIKVAATNNQTLKLAVGTAVTLRADEPVGGDYTVTLALAPAAPRGWRLYLSKVAGGATPVAVNPASASTEGSSADNTGKVFEIKFVSAGTSPMVRTSVQTLRVPFSRMSSEVSRITRSGSKIVSITEIV